jgi:hypothetical protein
MGIHDSRMGLYPHWKTRQTPSYPVVVTLEDWHTSMPKIQEELHRLISECFIRRGLPLTLLDERRCVICSAEEFDRLAQVISALGVDMVMRRLTEVGAPARAAAGLETRFIAERISVTDLFSAEFHRLGPSLDQEATAAVPDDTG